MVIFVIKIRAKRQKYALGGSGSCWYIFTMYKRKSIWMLCYCLYLRVFIVPHMKWERLLCAYCSQRHTRVGMRNAFNQGEQKFVSVATKLTI